MFDNLSDRLETIYKKLKGRGKLKEADVDEALREIRIALHPVEDRFELVISDNGVGLADLDLENLTSLGLQVVSILTDQLEGTLELDGSDGTTFKITFPAPTRRS